MRNKEKARKYFNAVNEYDAPTIEKMVREDYIQHNPYVPSGRAAFVSLLPKLRQHGSKIENVRMLQDGPYIIMHHRWKNASPFGADDMVAFHIIRFDDDGLIAEHWNVIMEMVPVNPSGRSLIDGETEIRDLGKAEEHKSIVRELSEKLLTVRSGELGKVLPLFFHEDFHQHNLVTDDGIVGALEPRMSGRLKLKYIKLHRVFGEGNFALSVSEGINGKKPVAIYDLYRFEESKIAEHWSVTQEIPSPEQAANDNTMFNFRF